MVNMLTLFLIGIVEMLVISFWTKLVSETKVLASGAVTVVNIFIWYYVLRSVVDNIGNFWLIVIYALGCATGTMISTGYFNVQKKRKKARKVLADAASKNALQTQESYE